MDTINKRLRRLTQPQILAAGVVTLLLGMALIFLVLGPLATALLLPLGEGVAAVLSIVLYFAFGWALGHYVGKIFAEAYYDRWFDDELHAAEVQYQELKARGFDL